jgi:hypothetical protein
MVVMKNPRANRTGTRDNFRRDTRAGIFRTSPQGKDWTGQDIAATIDGQRTKRWRVGASQKIRISKSKIRNKFKIRITEIQNRKALLFRIYVIRICFGFGVSDFGFGFSFWVI